MKPKAKKKLFFYSVIFTIIFSGYFLIIKTFEQNIIYFVTPKEIDLAKHSSKIIRIGGFVKEGSLVSTQDQNHSFMITDGVGEIKILYLGILPNLFREKQGVIVKGKLDNNQFVAQEILAKHDEKYMPKEVKDSLKKSGLWRNN